MESVPYKEVTVVTLGAAERARMASAIRDSFDSPTQWGTEQDVTEIESDAWNAQVAMGLIVPVSDRPDPSATVLEWNVL